jgi:DNA polymerase-3 subunit beta
MNITFDRKKMLASLRIAIKVVSASVAKPILQNVKLEVCESPLPHKGMVKGFSIESEKQGILVATDLEIGMRLCVGGLKVVETGEVLLPVKEFARFLRESTDARLRLESDLQGIVVRGERSEFKLPAIDPAEFPKVGEFAEEQYVELPAALFRMLVARTVFATDAESRNCSYTLAGVLLELEGKKIIAVGTDGRRLAKMEGPVTAVGGFQAGESMTIVPTRAMKLFDRVFGGAVENVQMVVRGNELIAKTLQATIFALIDCGCFPKWRAAIPQRQGLVRIGMTVGPVYEALKQVAVVVDKDRRGIDFRFEEGKLVMIGPESRAELSIPYNGQAVEIKLDYRYFGDFLRVLDKKSTFVFDVEAADSPAVCTTDDGYEYVIMPMA